MVCLCSSPEEVGRQLTSSTSTFPEADKIVLIANGFNLNGQQLAELRVLVPSQTRVPVQLESTLGVVSPEQALLVACEVLPVGAKLVAYCIKKCEVRSLQSKTTVLIITRYQVHGEHFVPAVFLSTRHQQLNTQTYSCVKVDVKKTACMLCDPGSELLLQ